MNTFLLPACKSITISSESCHDNINDEMICIGNNKEDSHYSYLFFDTSVLPNNIKLHCAELILFKTDHFDKLQLVKFCMCPLSEYFSPYTTYETRPKYNKDYHKDFYPITRSVAVEVDITSIMAAWLGNKIPNKGLMLGYNGIRKEIPLVCFGSAYSEDKCMVPFIRICYELLPCKVEVKHITKEKKCKCHPHKCPPHKLVPPEQAIADMIESIALEEVGLAHILNAEGEKIQRAVAKENFNANEVIDINSSVNNTLKHVFKVQSLLQFKLEKAEELIKKLT